MSNKHETRHMRGPGGHGRHMGGPRPKLQKGTVTRLLSYLKNYKMRCLLVVICILVSALAGVASSLFMKAEQQFFFPFSCKQWLSGSLVSLAGDLEIDGESLAASDAHH